MALQVRDVERSIRFYERYCALRVVHDRTDAGVRVAWLGWGEDPPAFVIVLVGRDYEVNVQPPVQHLGMSVASREEVDDIYRRALADGLTRVWPPIDGGAIVGYYCGVGDPDGNMVEFSCGQRIG